MDYQEMTREELIEVLTSLKANVTGVFVRCAIFNYALDGIVLTDDRGRFIDANPAVCELLGYPRQALLNLSIGDFIPGVNKKVGQQLWEEFIRTGQQSGEYILTRGDGLQIPVEYRAVANIQPGVHLSILRDITGRKEAEAKLRQSEEKFRTIFENAPVMINSVDSAGRFHLWNKECEKNLGYTAEEVLYKDEPLSNFYPHHGAYKKAFQDIQKSDGKFREYSALAKDGRMRTQLWANFRLPDGSNIATGIDITEQKEAELALQESEERFRAIFEQSDVAIFLVDPETGGILLANPAFFALLDYTAADLKELTHYDVDAHLREDLDRGLNQLTLQKQQALGERIYRRKDGTLIHVEVNFNLIDYLGTRSVCVIARDITRQKQKEKELLETKEMLEKTFSSIKEAVFIVDGKDRVIIDCNPAVERVFGYTPDELRGVNTAVLYPNRQMYEAFARQAAPALRATGTFNAEFPMKRKDGRLIFTEHTFTLAGDGDKLDFGVSVVRDITQRREAEERLRQAEKRARLAVEYFPYNFIIYDAQRRYQYINPQGYNLWGRKENEMLGKRDEEIFSPEITHQYLPHLKRCVKEKRHQMFERSFDINQQRFTFIIHYIPILDEKGQIHQILGIFQDISERFRHEERLKKSRQQMRALAARLQSIREEERANIARELHDELGQMLTGVQINIATLAKKVNKAISPQQQESIMTEMDRLSDRVKSTIKNVRNIITKLRPAILDNFGIVAAAEWEVEVFQQQTGIPCVFRCDQDEYMLDPARSTAIFRILQECLTNVARHANASRVEVLLSQSGKNICLEVRDNGRGISGEDIHSFQSLGLLGMKERVKAFGGDFFIQPLIGKGTVVKAMIPLQQPEGKP